ncbi:LapA family protein [Pseudarthrobacter sp. O4]|uniref:LapA family protein n=1 Tax=Pseudarthrobacter sp. O4 TaxID=3418417 RepID=UPI003CE93044
MTETPRGFDPNEPATARQPETAGASGYPEDGHPTQPPADGAPMVPDRSPATVGTPRPARAGRTARADRTDSADRAAPARRAGGTEPRQVTRAGMVWAAVASALVVLILLIAFILQNQDYVQVRFFGLQGAVALGVALFIAAVGGGVLVAIAGAARIIQLRLAAHRRRVRPKGRR